jgi:hypothetical protein
MDRAQFLMVGELTRGFFAEKPSGNPREIHGSLRQDSHTAIPVVRTTRISIFTLRRQRRNTPS